MDSECYSPVQLGLLLALCMPAFVLWAVVAPLWTLQQTRVFLRLSDSSKEITEAECVLREQMRVRLCFLSGDMQRRDLAWELFASYCKLTLVFISVFLSNFSESVKILNMLLFLTLQTIAY